MPPPRQQTLLAALLLLAGPAGCQDRKPPIDPDTGQAPSAPSAAARKRPLASEQQGREPRACKSTVPRADASCKSFSKQECTTDGECKGPHAYCAPGLAVPSYDCRCQNGCVEDKDCAGNQLCYCDPHLPVGRCVEATCRSDADCNGRLCIRSDFPGIGCNGVSFHCQTPADECTTSADCPRSGDTTRTCTFEQGRHVCRNNSGMCGRPLLGALGLIIASLRHEAWG